MRCREEDWPDEDRAVVDEGLGNSAYLADLGDGRALAVDVPPGPAGCAGGRRRHGLTVAFAADTHLHADFLSGALQLAAEDGAQVLASAAGGRVFDHLGLADGDEVDLGGLTLRAWATPGHTAEHLSLTCCSTAPRVLGVFTGGSLLVGAAARTDLSGPSTPSAGPVPVRVPATAAHPARRRRRCTRRTGRARSAPPRPARSAPPPSGGRRPPTRCSRRRDEDAFVKALLAGLGTFPPYFLRLPEQQPARPRRPAVRPRARPADRGQVRAAPGRGRQVVDVRPVADYAAGHVPGSLAIPLREAFATWLGWLVPDPTTPLVVVAGPGQDLAEVIWQALKIGYENLAGRSPAACPPGKPPGTAVAVTPLLAPGQVGPGRRHRRAAGRRVRRRAPARRPQHRARRAGGQAAGWLAGRS